MDMRLVQIFGRSLTCVMFLGLVCPIAFAQTPAAVDLRKGSYHEVVERNMATPGNEFGDTASLENGAFGVEVVDVSLTGNSVYLPVEFRRKYVGLSDVPGISVKPAKWIVNLPKISAAYASNTSTLWPVSNTGWITSDSSRPTKNCSVASAANIAPPNLSTYFNARSFWGAAQLSIPGDGERYLLYNTGATNAPSAGGPYFWTTSHVDYVSCLSVIQNPGVPTSLEVTHGGSEGYLVVTSSGTKYWFDWAAQGGSQEMNTGVLQSSSVVTSKMFRVTWELYPTRVEDRFGNWVTYTYLNDRLSAVKLSRIEASDGRRIDIQYDANNLFSSVAANGRAWTYSRGAAGFLSSVTNPDGSTWEYALSGTLPRGNSNPFVRTVDGVCRDPRATVVNPDTLAADSFVRSLVIKTPSGALGTFGLQLMLVGRSGVPGECFTTGLQQNMTPGFSFSSVYDSRYSLSSYLYALTYKRIEGPSVTPSAWRYHYVSQIGFLPVTDGVTTTTVLSPDGSTDVYKHGNVFEANEGLLLTHQKKMGSQILSSTVYEYELGASNPVYPRLLGDLPDLRRSMYSNRVVRPRRSTTLNQQGVNFVNRVNTWDSLDRPTNVTRSSTPVP